MFKMIVGAALGVSLLATGAFAASHDNGSPGAPIAAFSNGGCLGINPTAIAFSGVVDIDQYGNISTDNQNPLIFSAAKVKTGDKYQFGRIATDDGSTLEFNLGKVSGSKATIRGVYIASLDVVDFLNSLNGPSNGTDCAFVSSMNIDQMGAEPMEAASSIIGNQPFKFALISGRLTLNSSANVPY